MVLPLFPVAHRTSGNDSESDECDPSDTDEELSRLEQLRAMKVAMEIVTMAAKLLG